MVTETKNKPRIKGKITYTDGREEILEYGITEIENQAYYGRNDIASIVLPNSVEIIGNNAFCDCENLESVTIQNGVTDIKFNAFYECKKLKSVILPESLTEIGEYAFGRCESLESVEIPQNVSRITNNPFCGCKCKITVSPKNEHYKAIDNTVYTLDGKTLVFCVPGEDNCVFSVPEGVERIAEYAFVKCKKLNGIFIPGSVRFIGNSAFQACENITEIKIPEGVDSIEGYTFYSCKKLKSISIPQSVKAIGFCAFEHCDALRDVYYSGKKSDFKNVKIRERNNAFNGKLSERAKIHFA